MYFSGVLCFVEGPVQTSPKHLLCVSSLVLRAVRAYLLFMFWIMMDPLLCCYISFSVLFQPKSSLVWKSNTQKLHTIFQTNSSLVWKEKN